MLNRRQFGLALGAAATRVPAAAKKPHVLFIAIDDLNDWIGALGGHPQAVTPNMDKLLGRGMLFNNAHCIAPVCNPSRAGLMTGVRPSTSGVYNNRQPFRESPVLRDAVTLPMHLRDNGYRVLGTGKIYHGGFPDPRSWDDYYRPKTPPMQPRIPETDAAAFAKFQPLQWNALEAGDETMPDFASARWAAAELRKKQDKPLFLACGIFRPHLPWFVPKKYFDQFPLSSIRVPEVPRDDFDDLPPAGKRMAGMGRKHDAVVEHGKWKEAVQAYLASVAFADACIGELLRGLESSPIRDETAVVLWSDHGWHLGEKKHWQKFTLWERATRVVFGISAPGVTRPGMRCDRTVSLLDVYPTLCELTGAPVRKELEGVSLLPQLRNPRAPRREPAITTYQYKNHTVRTEQWRYIRYANGDEELYDHARDPHEWKNLAGEASFAAVKREMAAWLPQSDAAPVPERAGGEEK